ncbi:MAG: glycosyltransferase family 2 protein [bacterium JZ-2024 1]
MPPSVSCIIPTLQADIFSLLPLKNILPDDPNIREILIISPHPSPKNFPFHWITFPHKPSFSSQCNYGAETASSEFLLILNDDITLTAPLTQPLLSAFESEEIFAVCPPIWTLHQGKVVDEACTRLIWHRGFLWTPLPVHPVQNYPDPFSIPYFSGACVMMRKEIYHRLGGFQPLFSPAYWEDVDLSLRAWRRGFSILHFPAPPVWHHRGRSTSAFSPPSRSLLFTRNQLFFHHIHLLDPVSYRTFRLVETFRLFSSPLRGKWFYFHAYRQVRRNFPALLALREKERREAVRKEQDIWKILLKASCDSF